MSDDTWVTVTQAAAEHGKSVETIRRWTRAYPERLRTKDIAGTLRLHGGDLAALAADHPAPNPQRADCTREGHPPVGDTDAWESGALITVLAAADEADRTKTAIRRWAAEHTIRSRRCRCGGRLYIYAADLAAARRHYNRKRTSS